MAGAEGQKPPTSLALVYLGSGESSHVPWESIEFLGETLAASSAGTSSDAAPAAPYRAPDFYLWDLPLELRHYLGAVLGDEFLQVPPLAGDDLSELPGVAVVAFSQSRLRRAATQLRPGVELIPRGLDLRREAVAQSLASLHDLTVILRDKCPWDRKQTQETIVAYTLEEVYELVDAIKSDATERDDKVRSELGDLLFQVYFLARVAEQQGLYDLGLVADGIHRKLVRRHPHIFADADAETAEDVRRTWDAIKRDTEGREGIFHDVPKALPATLFAQKMQRRAASIGFDWEHAREVLAKIEEELGELEEVIAERELAELDPRVAAEMGDVLFAVVNLARKLDTDPELALRESSQRFKTRVELAAEMAAREGKVFGELRIEEQETYYQRAKHALAGNDTGNQT